MERKRERRRREREKHNVRETYGSVVSHTHPDQDQGLNQLPFSVQADTLNTENTGQGVSYYFDGFL